MTTSELFKKASAKAIKYFLRGVLITLPLAGIIWVINVLTNRFDALLNFENSYGLSVLIILAGLTFVGFVGSWLLLKPILDIIDDLLKKVPGVKVIYTLIKDFLEAFVGEKRKFSEPVAVEMSNGLYKMGFVTHKNLSSIQFDGFVAVYFPHSYNFSGNVFLVPAAKIKPINGNSSDVMKFIVTGGVTEITNRKDEEES
ncbi:MAG TPA: DUF502 domain-containing protein [Bacteroidia bacterium]|nr:DUF502 domain-containing protein [Bacteroidia bacterium]